MRRGQKAVTISSPKGYSIAKEASKAASQAVATEIAEKAAETAAAAATWKTT